MRCDKCGWEMKLKDVIEDENGVADIFQCDNDGRMAEDREFKDGRLDIKYYDEQEK